MMTRSCFSRPKAGFPNHATGLELGMRVLNEVLVEEGDSLLRDLGIKVKKWDPENIQQALKKFGKSFEVEETKKDDEDKRKKNKK